MHPVIGLVSVAVILLMLGEYFSTFLLPRRVKREPRIARGLLRGAWVPWRAAAKKLPGRAGDTMLGVFGPLGLLAILVVLSGGLIVGFAGLSWAASAHLSAPPRADFGDHLYFSASDFFSATTARTPTTGFGKTMQVVEAATGLGFLAIAIGYLPALFQAFSRRETDVARLDPRAGSPPSAGALLERSSRRGGWSELNSYLHEWEGWTAELMETHLSYPILGYFRSQHLRQNWLAALTTVVDACAYAIAHGPDDELDSAQLTFMIGRHALADLTTVFSPVRVPGDGRADSPQRLNAEELRELRAELERSGLHSDAGDEAEERLDELRSSYEPFAIAISRQLELPLPDWTAPEDRREYWRVHPDEDRDAHIRH